MSEKHQHRWAYPAERRSNTPPEQRFRRVCTRCGKVSLQPSFIIVRVVELILMALVVIWAISEISRTVTRDTDENCRSGQNIDHGNTAHTGSENRHGEAGEPPCA